MWTKFFALFLLFAVVATAAVDNSERKCVPGKRYNDGCNNCWCTETGITACTLMGCMQYDPATGTYQSRETLPPPDDFWAS